MDRSRCFRMVFASVIALVTAGVCRSADGDSSAWSQQDSGLVPSMVTFYDVPGPSEQALISSLGGRIKYTFDLVPTIAAWLPQEAVTALGANPGVLRIEPDVKAYTMDAELTSSWSVEHIGAGAVHASGNKGTGVKVGIIDSGIDYTHPDLAPNYAGGWDFVNDDADPRDDLGHGTNVAGIIGAADNGTGIVGVAPEADLYAYKVFDSSGSGTYSDVIAALSMAVADGMDVVNMSFGSELDPGQAVRDACANAAAAGLVLVASAEGFNILGGSEDTIGYPASYPSIIAVGATIDTDNERASFSGTGPDLDLVAPGVGVYTTDLLNLFDGYSFETGTSLAAPHVTGVAALFIYKGVSDVYNELISTAIDLGPAGWDPLYGYGLVNAASAVLIPAPSALGLALLGLAFLRQRRRSRS